MSTADNAAATPAANAATSIIDDQGLPQNGKITEEFLAAIGLSIYSRFLKNGMLQAPLYKQAVIKFTVAAEKTTKDAANELQAVTEGLQATNSSSSAVVAVAAPAELKAQHQEAVVVAPSASAPRGSNVVSRASQ